MSLLRTRRMIWNSTIQISFAGVILYYYYNASKILLRTPIRTEEQLYRRRLQDNDVGVYLHNTRMCVGTIQLCATQRGNSCIL